MKNTKKFVFAIFLIAFMTIALTIAYSNPIEHTGKCPHNAVEFTECNEECTTMCVWLDKIEIHTPEPNERPWIVMTLIPIDGGSGTGPPYSTFDIIIPDGGSGTGPPVLEKKEDDTYYIYLVKYKHNGEAETYAYDSIDMVYEAHSTREITLQ